MAQHHVQDQQRNEHGDGRDDLLVIDAQTLPPDRTGDRDVEIAGIVAEGKAADVLEHEGHAHRRHQQRDRSAVAQAQEDHAIAVVPEKLGRPH